MTASISVAGDRETGEGFEVSGSTFGIEEEFLLADPDSGHPVDRGHAAISALAQVVPHGAIVTREFYPSQIEYASSVFRGGAEAIAELLAFRSALSTWAAARDLLPVSSGTPFLPGEHPRWSGRYERIAFDVAGVASAHQINGLHVHVGVDSRSDGIVASNGLRRWLPVLLALSANSPFWSGEDTGFESWRAIHSRRWTTYGIPPVFDDAAAYDRTVSALSGIGATSDAGTINWNIRLSASHPTVEVRVFDAQLDAASSVALALITRALVASFLAAPRNEDASPDVWDAALWHAARHGMSETVVHPDTGIPIPSDVVLSDLRTRTVPHLDAGDHAIVEEFLAGIRSRGTGSVRQRAAFAEGWGSLRDLYAAVDQPGTAEVTLPGVASG